MNCQKSNMTLSQYCIEPGEWLWNELPSVAPIFPSTSWFYLLITWWSTSMGRHASEYTFDVLVLHLTWLIIILFSHHINSLYHTDGSKTNRCKLLLTCRPETRSCSTTATAASLTCQWVHLCGPFLLSLCTQSPGAAKPGGWSTWRTTPDIFHSKDYLSDILARVPAIWYSNTISR